jgi:type III secretory pathway lipoprotein EscJ
MNKLLLTIVACMTLITSCKKEVKTPLTKQEIQNRIDSIVHKKLLEIDILAQKELEYRIKIEVKIKADSIRKAMKSNVE